MGEAKKRGTYDDRRTAAILAEHAADALYVQQRRAARNDHTADQLVRPRGYVERQGSSYHAKALFAALSGLVIGTAVEQKRWPKD